MTAACSLLPLTDLLCHNKLVTSEYQLLVPCMVIVNIVSNDTNFIRRVDVLYFVM